MKIKWFGNNKQDKMRLKNKILNGKIEWGGTIVAHRMNDGGPQVAIEIRSHGIYEGSLHASVQDFAAFPLGMEIRLILEAK